MTIRRLTDGSDSNWLFEWIEEWSQFGPDYNWRTFHPFNWEIEDDRMLGAVETTLIILGLGFRLRWTYTVTEKMEYLKKTVEDIKAGLVETKPLDPDDAA